MRIRNATVEDARAIARLRAESWRDAYAGVIPDGVLATMSAEPNARFIGRLTDPPEGTDIVVAVDGSVIVGFANTGPLRTQEDAAEPDPPGLGEVNAIYVHPDRVGAGIGQALMAEAETRLRGHGLVPIHLWVLVDNPRARRFYERYGFAADGQTSWFTCDDGTKVQEMRYRLD